MAPVLDPSSLPAMEVAGRLGRLRDGLGEAGIDGLLVTKLENVRYLAGFSGSAGMLLVPAGGGEAVLLTDGRYRDQSAAELAAAGVDARVEVAGGAGQLEALGRLVKGTERLGLEAPHVSWALQARLEELVEPVGLVPTRGLVEALRVVKDPGEQARIERACEIADVALAQVKERLLSGCTEVELAAELEHEMRRRGASGPSFETIVASGPNSALPHARPTGREIGRGELVVIDFGALVDGYHSDMTRTLCVGEPPDDLAALVDAVLAAQRAGLHRVAAGVSAGEVDEAARSSLAEAGYGELFIHSTGHGVGLEIHEGPPVAHGSADILQAGSVVTVEPGAYEPGRGGVRIEDTVVVTATGARVLTKSTKDYTL
jgi:Xaa-Pro aminopeptidase